MNADGKHRRLNGLVSELLNVQADLGKGKTPTVAIKDWLTDADPGGPAGRELMYNFAELQPYFEEE